MTAAESNDPTTVARNLELLRKFPDRVPQQKFLEAIEFIGRARPLRAVPLLQECAKDESLRVRSLTLLGSCYAAASRRLEAIAALEQALAQDPEAHEARLNLMRILGTLLAWDEALRESEILIEKKYKLSSVHRHRAEILHELGQHAEAAEAYIQSIEADPTDPTNGLKATMLLNSLTYTGDYEKADPYVALVDVTTVRDCFNAERLVLKGEVDAALTGLRQLRETNPNDPWMNRVYGKAMLALKSPEKAQEGVAGLRSIMAANARDERLFEVLVSVAKAAGDDEVASQAQQNLDQLNDLNRQVSQQLAKVTATRDDLEARLALADVAERAGRFELARKSLEALIGTYPDRESEFQEKMLSVNFAPPLLVPLVTSGSPAASAPNAGDATSETPAADPPAADPPAADPPAADPPAADPPAADPPAAAPPVP
jgi:tetratricopeptide (TPR) repeat protein